MKSHLTPSHILILSYIRNTFGSPKNFTIHLLRKESPALPESVTQNSTGASEIWKSQRKGQVIDAPKLEHLLKDYALDIYIYIYSCFFCTYDTGYSKYIVLTLNRCIYIYMRLFIFLAHYINMLFSMAFG